MKRLFLVEPLVALYAFSSFLMYPIVQQYVYRRIWLQVTNTTFPISDNNSRCVPNSNSSSNQSHYIEEVQRQASLFSLYTEIFSTIPSLVVTLILVTYSDQRGRKIAIVMPLIGTTIYTLAYLTVSYFELNIYLLIYFTALSSLCGGFGTFLGACFAYISDLCDSGHQKTLRIAGLDMMIGLLSGLAAISSGYFLRATGFNWPFLTSAMILFFNIVYAIFFLEESMKKTPSGVINLDKPPQRSSIKQIMCGVCRITEGTSRRWKAVFALFMITFTSFSFTYVGGISMMVLYELNEPLCWTEILIGYGSALFTTVFLTSFVGVFVFTYCGVPQLLIVLLGILSVVSGMVMAIFAKTTILMFAVRIPMLLAIMPFSVLRSMMSKIFPKTEQGALFAAIGFMESLTNNVASGVFNSIYAATLTWFPGFVFLLSAGLCVIPLSTLGVLCWIGVDVVKEVQRPNPDVSEEETSVQDQTERTPLLS